MGEVHYNIRINGSRFQPIVNALLDTGSDFNVIGYELFDPNFVLLCHYIFTRSCKILTPPTDGCSVNIHYKIDCLISLKPSRLEGSLRFVVLQEGKLRFDGHLVFDIGEETYDSEGAEIFIPDTEEKQVFGTLKFGSITINSLKIRHPRFTTFVLMKIADEAIMGHPLMQYLEMVLDYRNGEDSASVNRRK